ncbi:msx2-interacting protein isoform X2 [Salminus brasiliensis]|uniref:msx2-interacting protein isoform X2 n=1 Tax=Salminus brasiliensis TaxID=930266 RepID=UPI003B830A95
MVRETRHLWVGNLPEHVREEKIVEHFKRYGRVESVKVLRKRGSEGGVAAFVDFVDIKSAQKAHNAVNKMGDRDLRTDYNEPGSVPSAVRGLDDSSPSSSHGREVAGFSRSAVGPVYGPPVSLHTREGRYERRLDGSSDSRDRAYEHSPYGHHERGGTFDRPRHYNTDYYRDRTMFASGVTSSPAVSAISGGFDTPETHFDSRIRDPFTLSSSARRDPYRDDRGRRVDRTYHHRRSRSSHSSQSRHPSPQRNTGQTPKAPHSPKRAAASPGRGPRSRSRSRSSSSDSVSSTSSTGSGSDSNSSSSEGSRARSVQSAATHVPPAPPPLSMDCEEPRRSFGIRVQNLPVRSTDTSLKDGLFHEFKKYGKVTSVQIHGASEERYGLVFFRQQEDQEKALSVSKGKLFFGMLIEVTAWNGPETESENEFRPLDGRIDEFHPKATRTLFIGNLEKTTNYQQLLDVFQRFGEIVDIDIKRVNGVPQYAFVQYSDIASVCKAIKKMDGEYLGTNRLKLGFGKSMPTTCVWLDGLSSNITEQYLTRHFCRYGHVVKVVFDRMKGMALVLYNNTDFAQAAVRETKGWKIGGNKIKVDFASQESQMAFYRSMQASGQDIRDFYELPTDRRDERRPPYHEFSTERAYYENVRTPGIYAEDPRREYPARSRERYTELEHYQGEHYDPRYHEDPREYRDYRDPFEQDIRKYSYIQRERERERERFEADRGRWSPSHQRRPISPSASPSPSDRVSRDAERRVYRHSSERSGSCSSLSPPQSQFEKTEKSPVDYKPESLDREIEQAEADRASGAEKNKRGRRKEKTDREKGEKVKSRRGKVQSPSIPRSEADREPSLDSNSGKIKVSDVDGSDRPRHKGENEPSPSDPLSRLEPQKGERLDQGKSESVDRDSKGRSKKHQKSELGNEGKETQVDSDRLAARKRRFGDPGCKAIRQKRGRLDEEQSAGVSQSADFSANSSFVKEAENDGKTIEKETHKREHSKSKSERIASQFSQREELDPSTTVESQSTSVRQGEHSEPNLESLDSKSQPGVARRFSKDGTPEKDNKGREEFLDIDLSQSYRKQMEQNRKLRQQLQEPDKPGKTETSQCVDTEDFEHRSLVHEVGKPPQDVTDNSPPSKSKKQDHFDIDVSTKRERVYRTSRPKSEDLEWNNTHSPRFQHGPQLAEEEYTDVPHLITVKEAKELPKPEDNAHPDMDLSVKRVHTSQVSKQSTPLLDEQQRRWESRLKQDLLPDFSRNSEKRRLNRKYLEYGLWPDLEPGEVRSDSEEDREHKPNSPMPSTSMSFPERHRGDRLPESKLTASLERNKFYSFALDQTITPDTKALLERAKSLSSSREDNWSFLDGDSHFASFRSRKDTEKVESTPRPTPSWYMKKKKIRSESEDKIDDRKEDPKPEEQERRELFASRFLHSSIFEQDSRRLQHLERKHEDSEHGYPAQQGQTDGQPDSEPVVLFHDRFMELTRLQQQKMKDQAQQESKKEESVDEKVNSKSEEEEEPTQQGNTAESNVQQTEVKPISPVQALQISPVQTLNVNPVQETPISPPVLTTKEMSPKQEACNVETPSPKQVDLPVKEEKQPEPLLATHPLPQETSESNSSECQEVKPLVNEMKVNPTNVVEITNRDVEPLSNSEMQTADPQVIYEPEPEPQTKPPELQNSPSPMTVDEADKLEKQEPVAKGTEPTVKEVDSKCADGYGVEEPTSPPPRSRNKKAKASPPTPVVPLTSPNTPDKQSTRKSERIDKERHKRSSSPRGESSKAISDKSSKSPIHSLDPEQSVEQNAPPVRARRRNVRSVYATVVEGESGPQTGKDVESPRSARKRGMDKDGGQQQQPEPDSLTVPATSRRGRPPKNRRQGDEFLAGKSERSKITETKEMDINETGNNETVTKVGKGKHSPYVSKTTNPSPSSVSGLGKKGDKTDKVPEANAQKIEPTEMDMDSQDSTNQRERDPSGENKSKEEHKPQGSSELKQEKDHVNQMEKDPGGQEKHEPIQEHSSLDKSGRTKTTRVNRSSKLMTEDKSLGLKNLRIRLDVTEVTVRLQTGENESGHDESPKKTVPVTSPKDQLLEPKFVKDVVDDGNTKEEAVMAPAKVKDPHEALLSRQMELEQAVENIAKLTEDPTPLQFKSPTETQPPLSERVEEPVQETEDEKPANPASETELAAAIDSITSEEVSCNLPQDPVISSVIDTDPDIQTLVPDAKVAESNSGTVQEETSNAGTPRKGKGRAKAQKRAKGQKASVNKKEASKEIPLDPESPSVKSLESIPELPTVTESSPPVTTTVITPSSKQDMNLTTNVPDVPKATEVPLKEQPDLPKSSGPVANKSPTSLKHLSNPYECTSPSLSPTSICLKPSQPRLPVSPTDRLNQPKETAVLSPSVTPSVPTENPALLSDSSPHDANTSDLRKILTKPRSIPIPDISPIPGSMHVRESDAKGAPHENRHISAQPVVRPPASLPSPEAKQVFSEKSVISVIASTATSVISRVGNSSESEEKPSLPIGNPFVEKQPPKQMYQPSMDDSSAYHGPTVGEEGGNAGRYIVESTSLSTGPTAGLRVNTSEGVVVLSHSGQKIEGRQRISAKISQIPPPSAVDIESQQLVSMPQIKQDLYSASQPATPKGSLPPSDHGHALKSQPNVPSIKQETGLDKLDPYTSLQSGVVKRLQQTSGPSQVMGFHHTDYGMVMKHPKKGEGNESLNVESVKPAWVSTISPAISPHLPSPAGNHVGFIAGTPTDRAPSHIQSKQEPRSPRKSGHPHSPFVPSSIGSSSPKGVSMVLPTGLSTMSQYVPNVHHSEQSVIMPPHSAHGNLGRMSPHRVGQTIPIGHLSQGEVRVNTPPLSIMNYSIHTDGLGSTWPPGQQRPTSPQAVGNREMVLKVNPANTRGHEGGEDEARRFHPAIGRPPTTQLKPESIPAEYRGPIHSGLPLERFNVSPRDMRMLMHHQQGERPAAELHQGHIAEAVPPTSTPTSITSSHSPRAHLLQKSVADKDALKPSELKRNTSPSGKDGMMGIRGAVPSMASPQRVQLIPSGAVPPYSEYSTMYTNLRTVHSQFPESSPLAIAQPPRNITPSQGVQESDHSQVQTEGKMEHVGHQQVSMVQLLTKYPIVWQGLLALKNDTAAVQLHFVCGNKSLGLRSLPVPETGAHLRIVQRMRLETPQLEGVARRMTGESDFCLLLAMPCGRDQEDVVSQTQALKSAFINYLKAKLAAGIINVPNPGSNQPAYVLQIFPPCEFSESHLSRLAPDLLSQISSISPHLMIVITSV